MRELSGVIYPNQTVPEGKESYFAALDNYHEELNFVTKTLLELGVNKITLNDAHCSMENINIAKINPKVELITGKPKPISMVAGLDNSYSCVFFTGYHAEAGSLKGVLADTFSPIFNSVKLNGSLIGEIELNSIYAGLNNVPIGFLTGDDAACNEAINTIGNINTVSTKTAISTTSAKCKPKDQFFNELQEKIYGHN